MLAPAAATPEAVAAEARTTSGVSTSGARQCQGVQSQNYSGSRAISIVRNPYSEEIDRRPFRGTRQPAGQWQGEQERARLDRRRDLRWNTASDQRLL